MARSRSDEKRADIYFNVEAVRRVYDFFFYIKIKDGKRYGRFNLTPYQAWILSEIFGWFYTADKSRRFRYAILYTARKSGKTVFSVGIELYMLISDREADPEAYLCATTREQAGQALRYTKNIVKNSPALKRRLKVQQFQILYNKRSGILKVLANKPDSNDSLNPYVFIIDEMHAHPTLDFFNVMKSGVMSRENPLGIITSTAGFNKDYPFFKMVETGKRTLEGVIDDDITFYALYCLDDDDDIEDYECWVKANPNIGQTIRLDALKKEYSKAKLTISELNNFITKNLNRYLDGLENWIPDDVYKTCFTNIAPPTDQRVQAFMGIDLSATRDLASIVIVWTDPATGKMCVMPEFYFPQNEVKRIRESGIDLGEWIKKGYIMEHDSPTINQELIFERIKYWNTVFEITQINYDKWNSGFIIPKVEAELYIMCQHFQQQTTWFNFPLKYIERLFFDEAIAMSENPVLRWMFRNIVLYYDGNGNIKIMKNKSLDSVDGPVSLAMAIGGWLQYNGDATAAFFKELMDQQKGDAA
ncbi:terminase large subunit [Sunxiuqinia indica]|uniref:terminase large subunit n=1 Tax=Sunxiuqinia indica TaxID=2692584 RepID=UPI00135A5587|nr:terminase TerL endonuclease subunit [Sunxiuqinia indica]